MTADGVWTYTLDNANCAVQALNACDTLTDTFKVTTIDGTAQVVTVTIHGTNDAPRNDFWSSLGDSFHFKDEIFGHQGSDAPAPQLWILPQRRPVIPKTLQDPPFSAND